MKFSDRIRNFMSGRYGADNLSKFLLIAYIVLFVVMLILSSIMSTVVRTAFQIVQWAMIFYIIYRMFSKNIYKRRRENDKYLSIKRKITSTMSFQKKKYAERNSYVYKKCPYCRANIRLPKRSGSHKVDCPACRREFDVKI